MGHIRLGPLPQTRPWLAVVALLDGRAEVSAVAAATSAAARAGFEVAEDDPGLLEAVWLLTQLPLAARTPEFVSRLRAEGLALDDEPSLLDLTSALSVAIDARMAERGGRTDLGELAGLSAIETLTELVGGRLPRLFGVSSADTQRVLGELVTEKQFGTLARAFFARLAQRYLGYYLSRELPLHVGHGAALPSIDAHTEFNTALARHCHEAARIVEVYAGEWYSKTNWRRGLTRARCRDFAHTAFGKLGAELQKRDGASNGH